MADQPRTDPAPAPAAEGRPTPWAYWLGAAWVLVVLLSTLATVLGLENLALALDFQRHLN